ncbi:hypothetical protein DAT32_19270 [Escherichia coli]|nr:hypothetical protein [Escherichia coli]PRO98213.1 hypothetical protein C6X67_20995 [Escherichia coli]PRP33044.1 hypothetical protein C6T25_01430 [Escherichia coli]PTO21527.1 hypothetical protein DAT32_19270 [Escherichia coli]
MYFLIFWAAKGNKADFRLGSYFAHSLKNIQLQERSGQGFYRVLDKICIAISFAGGGEGNVNFVNLA